MTLAATASEIPNAAGDRRRDLFRHSGGPRAADWLVNLLLENFVQKLYKIDLSKPLLLPDHVTHVEHGAGRATFYRSPNKNR